VHPVAFSRHALLSRADLHEGFQARRGDRVTGSADKIIQGDLDAEGQVLSLDPVVAGFIYRQLSTFLYL
jgi:hypothetical protein